MSKLPNISVADFAENLLEGTMSDITNGDAPIPDINNSSPSPQHMAPDVSKLEVPASMIESITGRPVAKSEELPVSDQRDDLGDLLGEAKSVVLRLKNLISEDASPGATSVGHIGTGPLGKARAAVHAKRYPDAKTYDDIMSDRGYISASNILPSETPGTETPKVTIPYKKNGKTLESRMGETIYKILSEGDAPWITGGKRHWDKGIERSGPPRTTAKKATKKTAKRIRKRRDPTGIDDSGSKRTYGGEAPTGEDYSVGI